MSEVLVYAVLPRAAIARTLLAAACQATGITARLEVYGSGSLYQRLGPRHALPLPDIVMWFGPFAAHAAGVDGLLQPYQPSHVAASAAHDPGWRWTTLDYLTVGTVGRPSVSDLASIASAPSVAVADPERSEAGMAILLSMLHRARLVDGDVERAWTWWQQRVRGGVVFAEDDAGALATVADGGASHALTLGENGVALAELAPIPNAIGLAANARNADAARQMLDWLTGEAASGLMRWSPWRPDQLPAATPPLDVEWARQQYRSVRQRWAQSGFAPQIKG